MQAIAEQSRIVRIPLNWVGSLNKVNRTFSRLKQEFQREPSTEELAEVLNTPIEEIANTLKMGTRQVSVNAPFSHGDDGTLLEVLEDDSERRLIILCLQLRYPRM